MTSISNFNRSRLQLADSMTACRAATLKLFDGMADETFSAQPHADFSPVGWHLGHIAYTEALWILQRLAGDAPLFPEYHRLFAQDGLAKCDRVHLPPIAEVLYYLERIRSKVLEYLQVAPLMDQERLWRWLLQHESQHVETIAIVLALQSPRSVIAHPARAVSQSPMCFVPAGSFRQGSDEIEAIDNESPSHLVHLPSYWIDQYPVTQGEYLHFIHSDGYRTRQWWSEAGWAWVRSHSVTQPLYWREAADDHPVCGVSWYEADAYARFVGKRLPTEAEWEKAASGELSSRYPWGNTEPDENKCNFEHSNGGTVSRDRAAAGQSGYGCYDLIGNVWEWTATWFAPYPGFESFPYPGYSQAYFDQAHRVLRGGSWATRRWAMRNSFRNWYHPHVREVFAGFRCARDGDDGVGM